MITRFLYGVYCYFHSIYSVLSLKLRLFQNRDIPIRLNLGCGDGWHLLNWIGVDSFSAYPYKSKGDQRGFDLDWDITRGLPFKDQTVEMIFSSHFLEHLTYLESKRFLKECYRVLKKGGKIRLVVPDLDIYIDRYIKRDETFFRNEYIIGGKWLGNLTDTFSQLFYSAPEFSNKCHKYCYNYENLSYRLKEAGFTRVTRSGHMSSQWSEFNQPVFDSSNPEVPFLSLYVEAEK